MSADAAQHAGWGTLGNAGGMILPPMPLIEIRGPFDARMEETVRLRLLEVTEQREPCPIWLLFDSEGGCVKACFGILEDLQALQAQGYQFGARIETAHSAAAILALACDWREISSAGSFCLHPYGSFYLEGLDVSEDLQLSGRYAYTIALARQAANRLFELMDRAGVRLTPQMNQRLTVTNKIRLNAQECLAVGAVHRITL